MISNTTISAKYTVTAGVLDFSIPFRIYKTTDVSVFWSVDGKSDTPLTLGTDYSASIGTDGGTVTLVSGKVPVGSILAIEPNFTATQETDLSSTTAISTSALETQLDKQTQLILQQQRRAARSVILPATSSQSPEDVVQSIYASRDAAAASADTASAQATAAQNSATAAAISANTAAQTVETAAAEAVNAATEQADAAALSAAAAAQSALKAAAAVPETLVQRVTDAEAKNTQQDTRLTAVESKNTQQDTRLDSAESVLSGKANTSLNNVDLSKCNVVLQRVSYETGAYASSPAAIPLDDTIPQITEGTQVLSCAFTPKSATSRVEIRVSLHLCGSGSNQVSAALFKDSDTNAISSGSNTCSATNFFAPISFTKTINGMGDTSAHTFTARIGANAGSVYMNGNSSGRLHGGVYNSSIIITEYAA